MSALAIALMSLVQAPATQWQIVFEGPEAILSVDPASIRRSGDTVTLRRRTEYRVTEDDGMRSLVLHTTIACAARTYTIQRIEGYREDGSLIRAIDFTPERAAEDVNPLAAGNAEARAIYQATCERPEA